jgi:hypothetical protein
MKLLVFVYIIVSFVSIHTFYVEPNLKICETHDSIDLENCVQISESEVEKFEKESFGEDNKDKFILFSEEYFIAQKSSVDSDENIYYSNINNSVYRPPIS